MRTLLQQRGTPAFRPVRLFHARRCFLPFHARSSPFAVATGIQAADESSAGQIIAGSADCTYGSTCSLQHANTHNRPPRVLTRRDDKRKGDRLVVHVSTLTSQQRIKRIKEVPGVFSFNWIWPPERYLGGSI